MQPPDTDGGLALAAGTSVLGKLAANEAERKAKSEKRREEAQEAQDPRESTRAFLAEFAAEQQDVAAALSALSAAGPAPDGDAAGRDRGAADLDQFAAGPDRHRPSQVSGSGHAGRAQGSGQGTGQALGHKLCLGPSRALSAQTLCLGPTHLPRALSAQTVSRAHTPPPGPLGTNCVSGPHTSPGPSRHKLSRGSSRPIAADRGPRH